MKGVKIGPPRERGKRLSGNLSDYELGVDPEILRQIGAAYWYRPKDDTYWRVVEWSPPNVKLVEIVWAMSPYAQGRA